MLVSTAACNRSAIAFSGLVEALWAAALAKADTCAEKYGGMPDRKESELNLRAVVGLVPN